ncbi:MAG: ABC transporter ATP-binding protein [Lachnospiraceae bacterium]|nr:ABC transporter ATP-binding protein [Lachnospiraceae bacterium]
MTILDVKKMNVYYGMIHAVKDISFSVDEGDIVTLIGANGAGKTTILQTLTGIVPLKSGKVKYNNVDISHNLNHHLVNQGIAHVPEGRRIFAKLSVYQNLKLGAFTRNSKTEIDESIENVYKKFPILKERYKQLAGTLSGGEQQMLAVGRALMSKPKLMFLDEPSMGLSPIYVNKIFEIIEEVHKEGVSILLVEQNAKKALSIANKAYVLETGKIVKEGKPKELLNDPVIRSSYLGE